MKKKVQKNHNNRSCIEMKIPSCICSIYVIICCYCCILIMLMLLFWHCMPQFYRRIRREKKYLLEFNFVRNRFDALLLIKWTLMRFTRFSNFFFFITSLLKTQVMMNVKMSSHLSVFWKREGCWEHEGMGPE